MVQWKVCGKEFKRITVPHITTHDMSKEEYDIMTEFKDRGTPDAPESTEPVSKVKRQENIFGVPKTGVDAPLSEFLEEFDISELELRQITRLYTTGQKINPAIETDNKIKIATRSLEDYMKLDKCEVTNLHLAEALTKNGFTVTDLRGAKGTQKKTWFLVKD